jgi:hypothetical protein
LPAGKVLTNGNKSSSRHSFLTHGAPLAYEVNFIKVEGIADNHNKQKAVGVGEKGYGADCKSSDQVLPLHLLWLLGLE